MAEIQIESGAFYFTVQLLAGKKLEIAFKSLGERRVHVLIVSSNRQTHASHII